jgi:ribosome maturation factor RimP
MENVAKIQETVHWAIENTDFKIVEIDLKNIQSRKMIRIFLDSEHGITIDECKSLSRKIGDKIEADNSIDGEYILEVSSPGVERPIKEDWQFRKNIGREILVHYTAKDKTDQEARGTIENIIEDKIHLKIRGKKKGLTETIEIPIAKIHSAMIQLKW